MRMVHPYSLIGKPNSPQTQRGCYNRGMPQFKRYLLLSQLNLYVWLLLSSFLASSVVFKNGGVSNYGNHYSTVVFYAAAFLGNVVCICLAANTLLKLHPRFKYVGLYLYTLAALVLMVFLTTFPRRFGDTFSAIHDNVSILLFAYEFLLALWLLFKRLVFETVAYFLIMACGLVVGSLSSAHVIHYMFVGQMLGALGFALLLVLVLPKVIAAKHAKS